MRAVGRKSALVWILSVLCLSLLPAGSGGRARRRAAQPAAHPHRDQHLHAAGAGAVGQLHPGHDGGRPGRHRGRGRAAITSSERSPWVAPFGRLLAVPPVSTLERGADVFK